MPNTRPYRPCLVHACFFAHQRSSSHCIRTRPIRTRPTQAPIRPSAPRCIDATCGSTTSLSCDGFQLDQLPFERSLEPSTTQPVEAGFFLLTRHQPNVISHPRSNPYLGQLLSKCLARSTESEIASCDHLAGLLEGRSGLRTRIAPVRKCSPGAAMQRHDATERCQARRAQPVCTQWVQVTGKRTDAERHDKCVTLEPPAA